MIILKKILRKGIVKIRVDTEDDLWYLKTVVEPGDHVKARTLRSIFLERDGKKQKIDKKPMMLTIEVEKVEFQEYGYQLRLTGKILEGPEDIQLGSYHTIEVKPGSRLEIFKTEWKQYHLEKLKKAEIKVPKTLIAVMDTEQATFGLLKRNRVEIISEFSNLHSIQEEEKLPEYYQKIAGEIEKLSKLVQSIVVAGPGFAKEHVAKILREKYPQLYKRMVIDTVSSATKTGINEILKKKTLDKIIKNSEIIQESKIIDEFFLHLKKEDGLAVYGLEDVKQADNIGVIKILLISDEVIRKKEIESLARRVERKAGEVQIISIDHDSGEQFNRMGGIGAILRFRVF